MYSRDVGWSILKFWCNAVVTKSNIAASQNHANVLKGRSRAGFGWVESQRRRIPEKSLVARGLIIHMSSTGNAEDKTGRCISSGQAIRLQKQTDEKLVNSGRQNL